MPERSFKPCAKGGWVERGDAVGNVFLEGLKRLAAEHAVVKEARGRGMLLGLELYPLEDLTVRRVYERLLNAGFLVGYYAAGNVLRFDPALTIEEEDIISFLACLAEILSGADCGGS